MSSTLPRRERGQCSVPVYGYSETPAFAELRAIGSEGGDGECIQIDLASGPRLEQAMDDSD